LKIATWNVNSLQVRLPHVVSWLQTESPDVLALQETKIQDIHFPLSALTDLGYHVVYVGEKSYNGVALLSKVLPEEVLVEMPGFADPQRRFLAATIADVRVLNLYVPNGQAVGSDKYQYKLSWLSQLIQVVQQQLARYEQVVLLGDFNIAPEDRDVHDPKAWAGQVLVSDVERAKWFELLSQGLVDTFRLFTQEAGHYSWWDYRMNAFKRNLGLRIDHILASHTLAHTCARVQIDRLPRSWVRPSDHVPVVAVFQ